MASCENCKRSGIDPNQMSVVELGPGGEKILIGPCCIGAQVEVPEPQVQYHLEFSSQNGLIATVEYGGLRIEYKKTPQQLHRAFSKNPVQEATSVH